MFWWITIPEKLKTVCWDRFRSERSLKLCFAMTYRNSKAVYWLSVFCPQELTVHLSDKTETQAVWALSWNGWTSTNDSRNKFGCQATKIKISRWTENTSYVLRQDLITFPPCKVTRVIKFLERVHMIWVSTHFGNLNLNIRASKTFKFEKKKKYNPSVWSV